MSTPDFNHELDREQPRPREILGFLLFVGGIGILVLVYFSSRPGADFGLPAFWYRASWIWPFVALALMVGGMTLQRSGGTVPLAWKPSLPGKRFQRILLFTRADCHLCDVAKDTLHRFEEWLPPIEEIDLNESPELVERYGTRIPVIEIDGVERFFGVVEEFQLKRLIEGTAPARNRMEP